MCFSQKIAVDVETFCVGGLQTQNFEFLFSPAISHMNDLYYITLKHSNTHFYKLSENIYFYLVVFNRFCFIIFFL